MVRLNAPCFEFIPHPPYFSDCAPSDHFLFSNLKKCFVEKKFGSNDGIIVQSKDLFEDLDKHYLEGIKKLQKRKTKFMETASIIEMFSVEKLVSFKNIHTQIGHDPN